MPLQLSGASRTDTTALVASPLAEYLFYVLPRLTRSIVHLIRMCRTCLARRQCFRVAAVAKKRAPDHLKLHKLVLYIPGLGIGASAWV